MEPTPAIVTIHLEPQDYQRFVDFATKCQKKINGQGLALLMLSFLVLIGTRFIAQNSQTKLLAIIGLVLLLFFGAVMVLYSVNRKMLRDPARAKRANPSFFLPNVYTVSNEGLFCRHDNGESVDRWHSVSRFAETETDFFVMLAEHRGHILPKRFFPTPEAAAVFANQVRLHLEKHVPVAPAAA